MRFAKSILNIDGLKKCHDFFCVFQEFNSSVSDIVEDILKMHDTTKVIALFFLSLHYVNFECFLSVCPNVCVYRSHSKGT